MKADRQRKAYSFLQTRINKTFTPDELANAAKWKERSATTYISKHLKGFVEKLPGSNRFKVRREFRRWTFEQYARLADQTRRVFQTYDRDEFAGVLTFEFLLPLTQEAKLTRALDDIFYSDTVTDVLLELGIDRFLEWVERKTRWSDEDYAAEIAKHVGNLYGGYSISHVSGRFRAGSLISRAEAGELFAKDRPYLIDETTASVRFIVPLQSSKTKKRTREQQLPLPLPDPSDSAKRTLKDEVEFARSLFFCLFVEALIRNVTGEDQIWLIEESPFGRRLHVWKPG